MFWMSKALLFSSTENESHSGAINERASINEDRNASFCMSSSRLFESVTLAWHVPFRESKSAYFLEDEVMEIPASIILSRETPSLGFKPINERGIFWLLEAVMCTMPLVEKGFLVHGVVDNRRTSHESFVWCSSQPMGSSPLRRNTFVLRLSLRDILGALNNTPGVGASKSFLLSPSRSYVILRIPGFSANTVNPSIVFEGSKTADCGWNVTSFSDVNTTLRRPDGRARRKSLLDFFLVSSLGKIGVTTCPVSQWLPLYPVPSQSQV